MVRTPGSEDQAAVTQPRMMANAEKNCFIKKERPNAVGCFCPLRLLIGTNQESESCDGSEYKCADLRGVLGLGFPRLTPGWQSASFSVGGGSAESMLSA